MENYSTQPGYSLYTEGKVTIRTQRHYGEKPEDTVEVWVGDTHYANFDGDEDNLCKVVVTGASIRNGVLTVSTATVDFEEPGVAKRNDYRYDVQSGNALTHTEVKEFEGGEPGSSIVTHVTTDTEGDILSTGREVVWNE